MSKLKRVSMLIQIITERKLKLNFSLTECDTKFRNKQGSIQKFLSRIRQMHQENVSKLQMNTWEEMKESLVKKAAEDLWKRKRKKKHRWWNKQLHSNNYRGTSL